MKNRKRWSNTETETNQMYVYFDTKCVHLTMPTETVAAFAVAAKAATSVAVGFYGQRF